MIEKRKIAWGVFTNFADRAISVVGGLVMIPVLFAHLDPQRLGLWFLLAQPVTLLAVLDFGLTPTLTRRIALARGKIDLPSDADGGDRFSELRSIIATSRILYRWDALLVFLVAVSVVPVLFATTDLQSITNAEIIAVASLVALSYTARVLASHWTCVLVGLGSVASAGAIAAGTRLFSVVAKIAACLLGGSLIELMAIDLIAAAAAWGIARVFAGRNPESGQLLHGGHWCDETFRAIKPLALRCWLTALGAFLILRTDQYFIVAFASPAALPDYQSALLIFHYLYGVAIIPTQCFATFLSRWWSGNDLNKFQQGFQQGLDVSMVLMIAGVMTVMLTARSVFDVWLGPDHFVGFELLTIFAVTMLLETHHVVFAHAVRATDQEAFVWVALGAGAINVLLTSILIGPFGLVGVAASTMVAQMLTNNWYAVYRGQQCLNWSTAKYFKNSLLPYGLLTLAMAAPLVALPDIATTIGSPITRIAIVACWCGFLSSCFLGARWRIGRRGSQSSGLASGRSVLEPHGVD